MKKPTKTKEQYQKELDQRIMHVADALTGKTQKYETYTQFFDTLGIPVSNLAPIKRGERHFSPYHMWLCRTIHNVSDVWLLTGDGEMFGNSTMVDKLERLEDRMKAMEKKLKLK